MEKKVVLSLFTKAQAFLKGHFILSSGLHSGQYFQCALLLSQPPYAAKLCKALAAKFKDKRIDVVIGPAYGGILVAYELARALGARALFAERKDGVMQLRRNFHINEGERVVIAEDVITTGKSVREVIDAIRSYKAKIVSVAALVDRSGKKAPFKRLRLVSLIKIEIKTHSPEGCPLCKQGLPLIKPGSRI